MEKEKIVGKLGIMQLAEANSCKASFFNDID
jgi:hypothetical protein